NVLAEYGEVTPDTLQDAGHDAAANYLQTAWHHLKKTGGKTADDPAWEADQELASEAWLDRVGDMKNEAREAFMGDTYMQQEAQDSGLSMEELWQETGNDYANEYWQSRSASKVAIKVEEGTASCPKCSSSMVKDVTDKGEKGGARLMECVECSHLFAL